MKKVYILVLLILAISFAGVLNVSAEEYQNFQEIVFDSDDALLLKDFSEADYTDALSNIKKRKFIGWKIEVVNENETIEFISETKLRIYNDGFTSITHDITLETDSEEKFQISASGSIKVSASGDINKFKGSIDADIKASIAYSKVTSSSEKYVFEIEVDPLTYVKIVTRGKGEINNGVGKYYFFWVETKTGGWETFTETTEYYEIIKDRI